MNWLGSTLLHKTCSNNMVQPIRLKFKWNGTLKHERNLVTETKSTKLRPSDLIRTCKRLKNWWRSQAPHHRIETGYWWGHVRYYNLMFFQSGHQWSGWLAFSVATVWDLIDGSQSMTQSPSRNCLLCVAEYAVCDKWSYYQDSISGED